jgi:hypothetical protein
MYTVKKVNNFPVLSVVRPWNNNYLCTYDLYGPVHNAFDAGKSITRSRGRGLGPGNPDYFWALVNGIEPLGEWQFGPTTWVMNKLLALCVVHVMNLPPSKALRTGPYHSEVHR